MEDLFYLTKAAIHLQDIADFAEANSYDCYFVEKPYRDLVVEYGKYYCRRREMDRSEFDDPKGMAMLKEYQPEGLFQITYSPPTLTDFRVFLRLVLERYGGWIENPNERNGIYTLQNIDKLV
jgi:hypothetical protein